MILKFVEREDHDEAMTSATEMAEAPITDRFHFLRELHLHHTTCMFFYISFLRPPPVQAGPYGTVSITPQISNDLRTDALDTPQDLYYAWALHAPLPRNPKAPLVTKAVKFTTLRPASAYKALDIPVPNGVREGQYWRLVLTGAPPGNDTGTAAAITLGARDVGRAPFPVMSMPIAFIGRGSKGAAKQEMIERTFLVPCRADGEDQGAKALAALSFRESTAFDLDKVRFVFRCGCAV